jgi:hypothetical protein
VQIYAAEAPAATDALFSLVRCRSGRITSKQAELYSKETLYTLSVLAAADLRAAVGVVEHIRGKLAPLVAVSDAEQQRHGKNFLKAYVPKLMKTLVDNHKLPAIVFNMDRATCDNMGNWCHDSLQEREKAYRAKTREARLAKAHQKMQEASALLLRDAGRGQGGGEERRGRDGRMQRGGVRLQNDATAQMARDLAQQDLEAAGRERAAIDDDDPNIVESKMTYPGPNGVPTYEDMQKFDRDAGPQSTRYRLLRRGIAINAVGLRARYLACSMYWFRMGKVGVVFSTDTLAQGINMPCRTVVVAGNDLSLSGLLFKQASGRSGRRGHDLRGDVIFFGVPSWRSMQLVTSSLPPLKPTLPLDAPFWASITSRVQTLQVERRNKRPDEVTAEARWKSISAQRGRLLQEDLRFVGGGVADAAAKEAAEGSFGAMKNALLRLGALRSMGKVVTLPNTGGLIAHLFPLGAPPLAVLLLLQTGALQGIVRACKSFSVGTNKKEVKRALDTEAKNMDAALLNVLARLLYPVPLFHGVTAEEAAAAKLQKVAPVAAAAAAGRGGADADAVIDAEVDGSPLRIDSEEARARVKDALKLLLRPDLASALPGVAAVELLRRPLNPFILRFYASAAVETLHRDVETELGVSVAVQYTVHSEMGRALKALGFALAARLAVALPKELLGIDPKLMRSMFHGGSDANDDDEEEGEEGNRAPRNEHVMDDFHEAFLERYEELDRTAVIQRFSDTVLSEVDTAIALLNLAGRYRKKFSQVRKKAAPRISPPPPPPALAYIDHTPNPFFAGV